MKLQNILRFLVICIALAPLVACFQGNRKSNHSTAVQSEQTSPGPNSGNVPNSSNLPNSNTGGSSKPNPGPNAAPDLDTVVKNGDIQKFDDLIAAGLKLRDKGVGIKAFKDAKDEELRGKIADQLVEEFREYASDKLPGLLKKAHQEGGYDDVIRFAVERERGKVGDAKVLQEFGFSPELFPILKDLNFDFDLTLPKGSYGLSLEKELGPMIVMMTGIGGGGGGVRNIKLEIAKALLDAGADINAEDGHGHTALYYVKLDEDRGYQWAQDLANFLRKKGAISK